MTAIDKKSGGNVTQPRAADDFATIRARMKELAREAAAASAENGAAGRSDPSTDRERRQRDRREGHPPPWAPTIFTRPLGNGSAGGGSAGRR
jgi:hypothetical protein